MTGPRIELDCDQLSRLAGWGDGDMTGDPMAFAINAISSLGRRLAVLEQFATDTDGAETIAETLNCERERCAELAAVLSTLAAPVRSSAPKPASPQSLGYAKAAASEHSAFHRAVAKAGLSHLFTRWLEAETKLATSLEVDGG